MRDYRKSDYAINRYSPNIVYRFHDEIVEVSLEDYLKESPDKTAQDFTKLKALSDDCLLYTSPSKRDRQKSRMPSSA